MRVLGKNLVVKEVRPSETVKLNSGIIVQNVTTAHKGLVEYVGEDVNNIKVGDVIVFPYSHHPELVYIDEQEFAIINSDNVFLVFDEVLKEECCDETC